MKKIFLSVLAIALLTGCKEDEEDVTPAATTTTTDQTNATDTTTTTDVAPEYDVPTSYADFANVSYGGQTDRLNMLTALTAYVKTSHNGDKLDVTTLNNMYANDGYTWTGDAFPAQPTKDLKSKTEADAQAAVVALFTEMATNSGDSNAVASDGVAGLVPRGSGHILVDASGKEYAQLIDKGLMGSCFYYQGTSKYLSDDKIGPSVDNETIEAGKGTAKEHHFDEAFGYFGVPKDFPTNKEGLVFWGKYANKRDEVAKTNAIMDAFLKGRAAITAKDKKGQDAAVADVKKLWEKAAAATGIHYLNDAIADIANDGDRIHSLTEGYAFIKALKYNMDASISSADVDAVIALIGENFWKVKASDLEAARDLLAEKTGLTAEKASL
jgi:hypothetical protein